MLVVYGLKNCDTCRKALKWLDEEKIPHKFHDVRADGVSASDLARFAKVVGWEKLLNKASTTWRGLSEAEKEPLDEVKALKLMAAHPALIKRPVFDAGKGNIILGFRDDARAALKKAAA